jgi:hypothetical protein
MKKNIYYGVFSTANAKYLILAENKYRKDLFSPGNGIIYAGMFFEICAELA